MKRFYSLELVLYTDPKTAIDKLTRWPMISHYMAVYHDRDRSAETNELLKAHTHLYLTFRSQVGISYVSKHLTFFADNLFTVNDNQIETIKGSLQDCYDYALHTYEDHTYKFSYSPDDLISDCIRLFRRSYSNEDNVAYKIICDLEARCSLRYMAQKYGRDFVLHYTSYRDFVCDMHINEGYVEVD